MHFNIKSEFNFSRTFRFLIMTISQFTSYWNLYHHLPSWFNDAQLSRDSLQRLHSTYYRQSPYEQNVDIVYLEGEKADSGSLLLHQSSPVL